MAKRARKTKPAFDPVRVEDPDEGFSAVALRALAARAHESEKEHMDKWVSEFKRSAQLRAQAMAGDGHTLISMEFSEWILASACDSIHKLTVRQCLALHARLSNAVVASWFPGCRDATVLCDGHSIDIVIRL
jgi:predicted secreted protein